MKYFNFKRYKFSTITNVINFQLMKAAKIAKLFNPARFIARITKFFDLSNFKYDKIIKYLYSIFKRGIYKLYKLINFKKIEYLFLYFFGIGFIIFFIYINIPQFFNYDKSKISKLICEDFNINCNIKGDIDYTFFPTPRINFEDFLIEDFSYKQKSLARIKNTSVKLSISNLLKKEKFEFNKIIFHNAEININLKEYKKYKDFFKKKFNNKKIEVKGAIFNFYENKENIVAIKEASLKYKFNNGKIKADLKGNFLNDKLSIFFENEIDKEKSIKSIELKLPEANIFTKIEMFSSLNKSKDINGNFLFKKKQNKVSGVFEYINNQIIFQNMNLRNSFLDGKFSGKVHFLPYFNFNLDVNLNTINFNQLYSFLINLKNEEKRKIFNINKKFNGEINLSVDKIYSKHTLIDKIESRVRFVNGDILIEQMLLNLKKLGAADITGFVKADKKFTIFKFENNIFVDNLKTFFNRFGVHNKERNPYNLFIAGNIDLEKYILHLDEISGEKKFEEDDVLYIEKEFNDIVLYQDYESFFNFANLKEFVKSISSEDM